jgi:predicted aldo/keto reductase-like oxidoreductase
MSSIYSRRTFVKSLGGMGLAAGAVSLAGCAKKAAKTQTPANATGLPYREVGKTGISVSVFSLGTGECSAEVLNAALERGVNLFHTSSGYMKGKSLEIVGQVIQGRRDKVIIALKDDFEDIETAFKVLGVTQVEFLMFQRHNPEKFRNGLPELMEKFKTWRDKGMVKFAGLTTHKNMPENLTIGLEAGIFSCFMPTLSPPELVNLKPQLVAAHEKGISILAMKTKGELTPEEYPKQMQAVLAEPSVASVLKGVQTVDDLDILVRAAAATPQSRWLAPRATELANRYQGCGLCGKCEAACPNRVATADIVRCVRYYHDAEKLPAMAAGEFASLGLAESLARCRKCGICEGVCPQGIPVRRELDRAREQWTVA